MKTRTNAGKERWQRITAKLFEAVDEIMLQLNAYINVLSHLQAYIKAFQREGVLPHMLHRRQLQAFHNFLGCLINPSAFTAQSPRRLISLELSDHLLPDQDIFSGSGNRIILQEQAGKPVATKFQNQLKDGLIQCAEYM